MRPQMERVVVPGFRFAVGGIGQSVVGVGESQVVSIVPGAPPITRHLEFGAPDQVEVREAGILVASAGSRWVVSLQSDSPSRKTTVPGTPNADFTTFFDESTEGEVLCRTIDG